MGDEEEANHDTNGSEQGDRVGSAQGDASGNEPDDRQLQGHPDQAGAAIIHSADGLGGHGPVHEPGDEHAEGVAEVSAVYRSASYRSAPLPDPQEFSGYEAVLPGAADRIIAMAEKEQDSLIAVREGEIEDRHVAARAEASALKVTIYCFAVLPYALLITTGALAWMGQATQSVIAALSALVAFTPQVVNALRRKSSEGGSDGAQ